MEEKQKGQKEKGRRKQRFPLSPFRRVSLYLTLCSCTTCRFHYKTDSPRSPFAAAFAIRNPFYVVGQSDRSYSSNASDPPISGVYFQSRVIVHYSCEYRFKPRSSYLTTRSLLHRFANVLPRKIRATSSAVGFR